MLVSNPDGSLPHADSEARAAERAFGAGIQAVISGADALPLRVELAMQDASVWHFATHGRWGGDAPLRSHLGLANGERMTLVRILELKVHARLVILSACDSGLAGRRMPDEVVSFPAGLLRAGVGGVVSSMWPVQDLSTALIITRFYQEWLAQDDDPAGALAKAQWWMSQTTNHELAQWIHRQGDTFGDAALWFLLAPHRRARPFADPHFWAGFYYTGA